MDRFKLDKEENHEIAEYLLRWDWSPGTKSWIRRKDKRQIQNRNFAAPLDVGAALQDAVKTAVRKGWDFRGFSSSKGFEFVPHTLNRDDKKIYMEYRFSDFIEEEGLPTGPFATEEEAKKLALLFVARWEAKEGGKDE